MNKEKIDSLLERYKNDLANTGRSPYTVKGYAGDLTYFITWYGETTGQDFDPKAVLPEALRDYRSYMQATKGLKPTTINRRVIALNRFFRWALRTELIADNPFEVMETFSLPVPQDTAPKALTHNEQKALLRAVRKSGSKRDLAIIQTLLGTGIRLSELASLKTTDLEISERKGWLHVRGKGNKERDIPLGRNTRKALADYLEERANHPQAEGTGQVFLGQRGPLKRDGIHYIVSKYTYQAQLEDCTVHTLRHTFAKNRIDEGQPLELVATFLGHESLDTTRIYTRPTKRDLERAMRDADFT